MNLHIAEVTGLTVSQVKHKRRAPTYTLYLDEARRMQQHSAHPDDDPDLSSISEMPAPEMLDIWCKLASIELNVTAGASFLKKMVRETGLTNYKIRTIRESLDYKKFLERENRKKSTYQQPNLMETITTPTQCIDNDPGNHSSETTISL